MRIGVVGCAGRMGRELLCEVQRSEKCELSAAVDVKESHSIGQDANKFVGLPQCGVIISDNVEEAFKASDAIIDFTSPNVTQHHLELSQENGTNLVLGTTGHTEKGLADIEIAAKKVTIVKAMNFSIGVNLLFGLAKQVSEILNEDYDIEIMEMHHRNKVDVPSGTAIALGEAAAKGRGKALEEIADRGRDGITGARKRGNIGFSSLRGGEVIGDHSVIYASDAEIIELVHKAGDRGIFSKGAVHASLWTEGQKPGLYNMLDVLGLI